jgi:hypothetical protein
MCSVHTDQHPTAWNLSIVGEPRQMFPTATRGHLLLTRHMWSVWAQYSKCMIPCATSSTEVRTLLYVYFVPSPTPAEEEYIFTIDANWLLGATFLNVYEREALLFIHSYFGTGRADCPSSFRNNAKSPTEIFRNLGMCRFCLPEQRIN